MRASLRWQPTEALVVDVIGTRTYNPTRSTTWRYFGDYPAYPAGRSPLFNGSTHDYTGVAPNPSQQNTTRRVLRARILAPSWPTRSRW